jgi:hypothetical protein
VFTLDIYATVSNPATLFGQEFNERRRNGGTEEWSTGVLEYWSTGGPFLNDVFSKSTFSLEPCRQNYVALQFCNS